VAISGTVSSESAVLDGKSKSSSNFLVMPYLPY
jgi:hypothetical protein